MDEKTIPLSPEQKKRIGFKIKQRRIEKNYSLEDFAAEVHMSTEALANMEAGDFELYDDITSPTKH